jgi:hypothetical protein
MTADVKRTLDIIGPWLHPDTLHPFLLVGPQGCGKRYCATNSSKPFRYFGKKIRDLLMSPKTYMLNELMKETPTSFTNPMVRVNMCYTSSDKLFCKNLLVCVIKIL